MATTDRTIQVHTLKAIHGNLLKRHDVTAVITEDGIARTERVLWAERAGAGGAARVKTASGWHRVGEWYETCPGLPRHKSVVITVIARPRS